MNKIKMKYVGCLTALIISGFSLSGCQYQTQTEAEISELNEEKDELNEEVKEVRATKKRLNKQNRKLKKEKTSLKNQIKELEEELEPLKEKKKQIQDEITPLEEQKEDLEKSIEDLQNTENELKEYNLEDLYLIDTSMIDSEYRQLFYILESIDFYEGAFYCNYDEEKDICTCKFPERLNLSSEDDCCFTDKYSTIGLQSNIIFYLESHCFKDIKNKKLYYFESIHSSEGYRKEPTETDILNNDAYFESLFIPLMDVINDEDIKISYTVNELKALSDKMNKGNYEFNNEQQKVFTK